MNELLKKEIDLLPDKPGCYLMHNSDNEIIYIGKAKNLKRRVSQYFLRSQSGKTAAMVFHVDHFETIITKSEKEALILEMNLIQKHHPRYNIMLMDDKHYPYIAIHKDLKEPYVGLARNIKDKKCEYYGPFPNRKCKTIPKTPCLYYHIGQCLGPCINKIEKEKYDEIISNIRNFLKGNNSNLINELKSKIKKASEALDFESARDYKMMLDSILHINEKQNVEFKDNINRDVFAFYTRDNYISIACFIYRQGILLSKRSFCYELIGDINEFVSEIIYQYYTLNTLPKEVIVSNTEIEENLLNNLDTSIIFPSKGKLHDVILTVEINAKEALDAHFLTARLDDDKLTLLERLGKILNIKTPLRIELFDNSHLQGTNAIGAMVVFINGEPVKKMYRKFNIEGFNKKDDLASMKETLTRRYSRLKQENESMPDLIIVDGGKTQVEVANEVMSKLDLNIPIAGLFKTDKHRTSGLLDSSYVEHYLDDDKSLFFLLTRMQDEVHRYAITTHIKKRNKSMFNRNAKIEELMQIIPESAAKELYNKLRGQ